MTQTDLLQRALPDLMAEAAALRDTGHGPRQTYSRKVFIPLTRLCRDVCHYCSFAETPRPGRPAYLSPDEVLAIARAGRDAGCTEALFTLGDKPERRYAAARTALAALGHATTIAYLAEMCGRVLRETGLLPHANPGVMTAADIAALRPVTASLGMMLEQISPRLCEPGAVHHGSPDKHPATRLATLRLAGEAGVPFTTGLLIGIGETRAERLAALQAIADLHAQYGHIQEVIIQNFRAKPGTRAAEAQEPDLADLLWTIAVARLVLGPAMNLQAPPNLSPNALEHLIAAGINDWGGVSPVTPDHVNPEAPWPAIDDLARRTAAAGKFLIPRLAVYPGFQTLLAPAVATRVLQLSDSEGFFRDDDWAPGLATSPRPAALIGAPIGADLSHILDRAAAGTRLDETAIIRLFAARDRECQAVLDAADQLRRAVSGDVVRYVVNRNINYTNICLYKCRFCAFSKGTSHAALRGQPYDLALDEITRRAEEAFSRGATELCLQGGIHPDYTGDTYRAICRAIRQAVPAMHIHAFSPLEISQGAATLGLAVGDFLALLQQDGLATLPGTAAEILDDDVRAKICPDKLATADWLAVMRAAHARGLRSTATIMFGHVETSLSWARHLLAVRDLQVETGGFTEFVPLPFVHMEAPMYRRGQARRGPTFREALLMHAVSRLALHPVIPNIQTSWVKMGRDGAGACLRAGANDLGGTLMNESISRAAGTTHGQEFSPIEMEALIGELGRVPQQRDTLYRPVTPERRNAARHAAPLSEIVLTKAGKLRQERKGVLF